MQVVRGRRRERVGIIVAFSATLVFWFTQAWQHVAYLNDDLILFHVARQGLSPHLLFYNLFEHFSPIDHLFYWLELHLIPLDPRVGTAIVGVILLLMLSCLNWLLRELQVAWPLRVAGVALVGTSFVTLVVTTWWGQAVYIPVALSAMLLVMAAHVRGTRLGSRRWHIAACGFSLLGLLISERTLFTPGYLVLLDLGLAMRAQPGFRTAVRSVWSNWRALAPLFAISVAGAAFIRAFYYTAFPLPHLSDVVHLIGVAYAKWFLPSLGGFYSQAGVPNGVAIALVVASAVACVWLLAGDRRNLAPIALFATAFVVDYGFLGIGRLGLFSVQAEASDIQYVAWILPLFVVAVVLIRLPVGLRRTVPGGRYLATILSTVVASAVLANVAYVAHSSDAFRVRSDGYQYWMNLRDGMARWSSSSVAVLPLGMPPDLAAPFVDPYGRMEVLLPEIDKGVRVGLHDGASTPIFIDAGGMVHAARLRTAVALSADQLATAATAVGGTLQVTGTDACLLPRSGSAYLQLPLPRELTGAPLLIELSYVANRATSIRFTSVAGGTASINPLTSPLYQGAHTGLYYLEGTDVAQLQITSAGLGSGFCLRSLSVVSPVALEANDVCRTVDRYGQIGGITSCIASAVTSEEPGQPGRRSKFT
jgi:hypothetical protein